MKKNLYIIAALFFGATVLTGCSDDDNATPAPSPTPAPESDVVDLGLPSGTLWAKGFEKDDDNSMYFPYIQTKRYNIPTKKQWEELVTDCKWGVFNGVVRCTGKNGAWIDFGKTGGLSPSYNDGHKSYLWLSGDSIDAQNELACIYDADRKVIEKAFMGYKYPIRQVK